MGSELCVYSKKYGLVVMIGNRTKDSIMYDDNKLVTSVRDAIEETIVIGDFDETMERKLTDVTLGDIVILSELAKKAYYDFSEDMQELKLGLLVWRLIKAFDEEAELVYDYDIPQEEWNKAKKIDLYDLIYKGDV